MSDGLLGNLLVKIIGDKSDLDKALSDSEAKAKSTEAAISKNISKLGDTFGKVGKALTIGLTAPLIAAGAAMVKLASDTGESLNAANVVFKESTSTIKAWGENAAEQAGLTAAEFYQSSAVIGAGLINAGASAEVASKQTIELTKRAADMASIFNTSVADAMTALQAGLRGESEPLRRFAISLDEASVKAKAVGLGLATSVNDVDAYAKSQARLALIMEQSSRFQGDFVNTSDQLANGTRIVTAQIKEEAAKFGELLLPVIKDVLQGVRGFVSGIASMDQAQRSGILTFGAFAAAAGPVALGISAIIKAFTTANPVILAVTTAIGLLAAGISAYSAASKQAEEDTNNLTDALAMQANLTITQKALDETIKKIEKLQIVMRASPNSEAFKKQLELLEAQKATLESNISTLNRKAEADKKAAEAVASLAISTETETDAEEKQIQARKEALATYTEAIAKIKAYRENGLIPAEEATKQTTAATEEYAKALLDAGYKANEQSIGGRALAKALDDIDLASKNAAAAMRDIPPLSPLDPEAVQSLADFDTFLAEFRERRRAEEEEESAALAKKKAEETAYLDIIKNGLNETNGAFVALGEAFVTGENPMKAFFKSLIGAVGDGIIAFAALTTAQGWASVPIGVAKIIKGAALAVLGGTVKAAAASLASGGIASGPTLAVVGDNPYADEMVAPLTPDTFRGFADGLLAALSERSRPAGVTEATVSAATVSGSSGAGSTVNLHVGTLIADDAGMRKLNRELRKFGLQENVRTGYGG